MDGSPDVFTMLYLGRRLDSIVGQQVRMGASIERTMDRIETTMFAIEAQAGDATLRDARQGFEHLGAAARARNTQNREAELRAARMLFGGLASHDVAVDLESSDGEVGGAAIAALGHLGNYAVFLEQEEDLNAAVEAYRCTVMLPGFGVRWFAQELYSEPFRAMHEAACEERDWAVAEYASAVQRRVGRGLRKAGWATGAIASGLLGMAIAPFFPPAAIAGVAGVRSSVNNLSQVGSEDLAGGPGKALREARERLAEVDRAIRDDCALRLQSVDKPLRG